MTDIYRLGPLIGCASSILFALSWIISALLWGDWVLGSNSLSDIGVCGIASAEIVFNMGCAVTGVLVLFLAIAMIEDRNVWIRAGGYTAFISGIACLSIGVINEGYEGLHNLTASLYAVFAAATIALSGAGVFVYGKKVFTFVAAALLIASGISSLTCPFGVFEPIGVSCILIWTFILSVLLYLKNKDEMV